MLYRKPLKELANIRSGYLFRSRVENEPEGSFSVIQLRDISNDGIILNERIASIKGDFRTDELLKNGDVIFKAKSNNWVAAVFEDDSRKTIVTVHYFIIRLKDSSIIPNFLAWYLNQRPAQEYFETHAKGTRIPIINKEALANLEVMIPEMAIQKKIVDLYKLSLKERMLIEEINNKRAVLLEGQLLELMQKKSPG